jgi:hypothetical protein
VIKIRWALSFFIIFCFLIECCLYTENSESSTTKIQGTLSGYTNEEIEYFKEIALGSEYRNTQAVIRKWGSDIRIKINGNPGEKDIQTLNQVISDLNSIIGDKINISIVDDSQNIDIYFVQLSDFSYCDAVTGDLGYFNCKWQNNVIYNAKICIAIDKFVYQEERSHNIREELPQCLGLMKDSTMYKGSIFYNGYSATQKYAAIDIKLIEILYSDEIKPGMGMREIDLILKE